MNKIKYCKKNWLYEPGTFAPISKLKDIEMMSYCFGGGGRKKKIMHKNFIANFNSFIVSKIENINITMI